MYYCDTVSLTAASTNQFQLIISPSSSPTEPRRFSNNTKASAITSAVVSTASTFSTLDNTVQTHGGRTTESQKPCSSEVIL